MTTGNRLNNKVSLKDFLTNEIWLHRERPWVWWFVIFLIYIKW